jgi:hypothetical protein
MIVVLQMLLTQKYIHCIIKRGLGRLKDLVIIPSSLVGNIKLMTTHIIREFIMNKLFVLVILLLSGFGFASPISEKYEEMREEQYYRFKHETREERHRGRIRIIRAKIDQKVRGRYCRGRRGYSSGSLYSMRACPR